MPESPDQHLIDALVRPLGGEDDAKATTNGHHKNSESVLSDEQVIELCRKARNAAKFASLFDDEDISGYASRSEADLALLGIIGFYTQDPEQLERIFSSSALARRGKWNRRSDYRRRTIDKALSRVAETYTLAQPKYGTGTGTPICNSTGTDQDDSPKLVKFRDIERKDRPKDIVEGLVPANSMTLLYGAGGVAKSYLALQLGMAVAGAVDEWLGFAVEHGPVVFGDFELDASEHGWRSHRLCAGLRLGGLPEDLYYMELAARRPRQAFDALYEACVDVKAKLLIIDSLTVALEGDVEIARDFIGFVNHQVGRLRKAGVATLGLDHQGKLQSGERYQQKTAFGTAFKRHLSRSYAQLEPGDHGDGFLALTLRHQKQNFAPLVDPFGIRVVFEPGKVLVTKEDLDESVLAGEETINARERVYKAIKSFENEEGTKKDVAEATGLTEGTSKKGISNLKRESTPRAWDTGRVDGRLAIVTTKRPSEPSGTGTDTYKGTGTGTDGPHPLKHDAPLSAALASGESATLAELKKRREGDEVLDYHHNHPPYKESDCDDRGFSYVTTPEQLSHAVSKLLEATLVGLDLETVGTNPATGTLRLVQVSDGESTFVVDAFAVDPKPLLDHVVTKEIIAHNALFELSWLKHLYNLEPTAVHDTMLMSQVLNAGKIPPHEHGLAEVAKRELGIQLDKTPQRSDWSAKELSQEQLAYAALDARILPQLYRKLKEATEDA